MADGSTSFEEFYSSEMSSELRELAAAFPTKKSLSIDFQKLAKYDPTLADSLLESPDAVIKAAESALRKLEHPTVSGKKFEPHVRFYNLPDEHAVDVQYLGAEHLNKLARVDGVVSWVTEIKPLMKTAVWQCLHCANTIKTLTEKNTVRPPGICKCGHRDFKLMEESSEFLNVQRSNMQESVEKLRGSAPASHIELWMEDDLTNRTTPGEKLSVTGILRLRQIKDGKTRSSIYAKFLDVSHIQKREQEFEDISISKEDEQEFNELAKKPNLQELITKSIAPSIYGYDEVKNAIALQLFGGTPNKIMPDQEKIRADIHVLLIGDPGCLIADERVVRGDGAILKIGALGEKHLQEIDLPLLTGQGYKRANAKVFHKYAHQPLIEVVTESGKCIIGTLNHPLLAVFGMQRNWKRLDEIKKGDRLAVATWIPCTITKPVPTHWTYPPQHFGPKNKTILPQELSPSLAGLLGYLVGDGWVSRTRFAFDVNPQEKDLLPKLTRIIEKEFAIKPHVLLRKPKNRNEIYVVQVDSVAAATNLAFLKQKRVPDLVLQSGNSVAAEFLAWLFEADGTVFSKGRGRRAVQLKSANAELLRDVQMLLLRFGIHSRIVERNLIIRRAQAIRKYAECIGFKSNKKKQRLAELVEAVKELHHELGKQLSERVVSVKKAGYADVFDVEVPDGHRFIANGIISHNTAKSSILEYVNRLSPKSVFVSGGGASGVGLTASAERDSEGEGWILKAGAMVLASGGLAVIDEFDKMGEEDRAAIHGAMEQQFISIAKAGIVTQFQTRTSVLAAANPKFGRFDPTQSPAQQFNLSPALISRFDLIFPIRDVLDETRDKRMAEHILLGHRIASEKISVSKDSPIMPAIEMDKLRKYIAYARKTCFPILTDEAMDKIKEFYIELRKLGAKQNNYPITPRQIEGIIRLAESSAKSRLNPRVEAIDADRAIAMTNFVLNEVFIDKETGHIDSDVINIGQPKSKLDKTRSIISLISTLEKKVDLLAIDDVVKEATAMGIDEHTTRQIIDLLKRQGDLYEPKAGHIKSARRKEW